MSQTEKTHIITESQLVELKICLGVLDGNSHMQVEYNTGINILNKIKESKN